MAIILETITHVWFAGRMIPPGEVFSADDVFATKLIEGGSAKVTSSIESNDEQVNAAPENEELETALEDSKDEQPKGRRSKKVDDDLE